MILTAILGLLMSPIEDTAIYDVMVERDSFVSYSPSRKLTEGDFKGQPRFGILGSAVSSIMITLDESGDSILNIRVWCVFKQYKSTLDKSYPPNDVKETLAHEQLHFDASYAAALKMVSRLKYVYRAKDCSRIFWEEIAALDKEQDKIDNVYTNLSPQLPKENITLPLPLPKIDSIKNCFYNNFLKSKSL